MSCPCGCGREVDGIRARAAAATAGQLAPLVALLQGAAERLALEPGHAQQAAALVPLAGEGRALLDTVLAVVHGQLDRGAIDKRALRRWLRAATGASTDLYAIATALGFEGPTLALSELAFTAPLAHGTIVSLRDTGTTIGNDPRVAVVVQLDDPDVPLLEQARTISRVRLPRVGDRVEVARDGEGRWAFRVAAGPRSGSRHGSEGEPGGTEARLDALERLQRLHEAGVLDAEGLAAEVARSLAR